MAALSLRRQLYLIATAPLIAFLWLSITSVWNSYQHYAVLDRQMVVQTLAMAGGRIAQVLPAEAFATPDNRAERRKAVDEGLSTLKAAYAAWQAQGGQDPTIEKAFALITEKEQGLATYRKMSMQVPRPRTRRSSSCSRPLPQVLSWCAGLAQQYRILNSRG